MSTTETSVKERALPLSAEEVRSILAGNKTPLRIRIDPQPFYSEDAWKCWMWRCGRGTYDMNQRREEIYHKGSGKCEVREYAVPVVEWLATHKRCPFKVGARLWVRETWSDTLCDEIALYKATANRDPVPGQKWRSAMHMPRWASRLVLEIESVGAEQEEDGWFWRVGFRLLPTPSPAEARE